MPESTITHNSASFFIRIQYRQNTTWQGSIQWLDRQESKNFRSFLELVLLMEEALSESCAAGEGIEFRNWTEQEDVS